MRAMLLAALLMVPAAAMAQALDMSKGGPVEVTASEGLELRQNEQMVIARGSARAVRGDVTVTADRLTARYRRKAGSAAATPAASTGPGAVWVRTFRDGHAWQTAKLRPLTKRFGLSLGDRACITAAMFADLPILTSDRRMAEARDILGLDIRMIR